MQLLKKLGIHNKEDFKKYILQFIKFGIVGLSNTLINLAVYYVLLFLSIDYRLAYSVAFVVSVLNAYYWNNKYVFKNTKRKHNHAIFKVYAAYGFTFLLSLFLLYIMVDQLRISDIIAPMINLIVTIPLNFILNKYWAMK